MTTNYVLTELVALFTSPLRVPRTHQVTIIEGIRSAAWVEVVHVDPAHDNDAWSLLRNRLDKGWSWVDCATLVLMRQQTITDALTSDYHFEQAGFVRLLK